MIFINSIFIISPLLNIITNIIIKNIIIKNIVIN